MSGDITVFPVDARRPSTVDTARRLVHRLRKYWPEIIGFLVMMAYTAIRTLAVAHGVDTVAHTSWKIFLAIEIITTVPYVWGIGDLVRGAMTGAHSKLRGALGMGCVLLGIFAPYVYLLSGGGLRHIKSAVITAIMVVLALIGLTRSLRRLARTSANRRARQELLAEQAAAAN